MDKKTFNEIKVDLLDKLSSHNARHQVQGKLQEKKVFFPGILALHAAVRECLLGIVLKTSTFSCGELCSKFQWPAYVGTKDVCLVENVIDK